MRVPVVALVLVMAGQALATPTVVSGEVWLAIASDNEKTYFLDVAGVRGSTRREGWIRKELTGKTISSGHELRRWVADCRAGSIEAGEGYAYTDDKPAPEVMEGAGVLKPPPGSVGKIFLRHLCLPMSEFHAAVARGRACFDEVRKLDRGSYSRAIDDKAMSCRRSGFLLPDDLKKLVIDYTIEQVKKDRPDLFRPGDEPLPAVPAVERIPAAVKP